MTNGRGLRVLVAGLGAVGQRHARNLRELGGDRLELLAYRQRRLRHVITPALERDDARDVEETLGVTAFDSLDDALARRPDAVFVCTPTSGHVEIAERAAQAGCHLFIEKPLSHTLDGVDRLRAAVSARRLVTLVGCQWRFHPAVRWLRDSVRSGALGSIERAEIEYAEYLPDWHPYEDYRTSYAARTELGGGVVLTQIHDYDLAWWLFGPMNRASATGGRLSDLEIDVEDTVEAQLDGGLAPVTIRQSLAARPARRVIHVVAERGSVTVDLLAGRLMSDVSGIAPVPCFADYQRNQMFVDEAAHFLDCIAGRARPSIPLDEGVAVLRVALAVKASMTAGRPVAIA